MTQMTRRLLAPAAALLVAIHSTLAGWVTRINGDSDADPPYLTWVVATPAADPEVPETLRAMARYQSAPFGQGSNLQVVNRRPFNIG